jgi:hypothetical protein
VLCAFVVKYKPEPTTNVDRWSHCAPVREQGALGGCMVNRASRYCDGAAGREILVSPDARRRPAHTFHGRSQHCN